MNEPTETATPRLIPKCRYYVRTPLVPRWVAVDVCRYLDVAELLSHADISRHDGFGILAIVEVRS